LGRRRSELLKGNAEKSANKAGRGSVNKQAFAQTGLIILFHPAVDADDAVFLLEAHDAVDLGLIYGADLLISHAAFGALKP
jgi:hypothetical protein